MFVSVQPDRTAQFVKAEPQQSDPATVNAAQPGAAPETATWNELIRVAYDCLKGEPVTAAYTLINPSERLWAESLAASGFQVQGQVKTFSSPLSWECSSQFGLPEDLTIEIVLAADFQPGPDRDVASAASLDQQVLSLLDNTVKQSDDCFLRTQLEAEDVLALFAFNPETLIILLAKSAGVLTGLLVANDSQGPNRGQIEYLGVHSGFRRRLIASSLLDEFSRHISGDQMTVGVHEENWASLGFFGSRNFKQTATYELWTQDLS